MNWPDELRDNSRASGWLNKLLRASKAAALVSVVGGRLAESTHGTTLAIDAGGGGGGASSSVERFTILSTGADFVNCRNYSTGANVTVSKPYPLRVSSFFGLTIGPWKYSGTDAARTLTYVGTAIPGSFRPLSLSTVADSIREEVDRPYVVGQEIYAMEPTGGTGVTGATWLDLNIEARRWRAVRTQIEVCKIVNGVQKQYRMIVDGGPPYLPAGGT